MLLYHLNHSTHEPLHSIFIFLYSMLIIIAFTFNSLVLWATYRRTKKTENDTRPGENKTRYILIGYLCIFDVLLIFATPLTALDALSKFWPFGIETEVLCKVTKSASAAVVYSSSMLIILIAFDSFQQITCPSGKQLSSSSIFRVTTLIMLSAIGMAFPLFYFSRLIYPREINSADSTTFNTGTETSTLLGIEFGNNSNHFGNEYSTPKILLSSLTQTIPTLNPLEMYTNSEYREEHDNKSCSNINDGQEQDWSHVIYCVEDWQFGFGNQDPVNRVYYSVFSLIVQYFIPMTVISALYFQIYQKLGENGALRRFILNMADEDVRRREYQRSRGINRMLLTISVVFCFCWFPLNMIGVLLDASPDLLNDSTDLMTILFIACNIIGMSSACINPILYGLCQHGIRSGNEIIDCTKFLYSIVLTYAIILYRRTDSMKIKLQHFLVSEINEIYNEIRYLQGGQTVSTRRNINRRPSQTMELIVRPSPPDNSNLVLLQATRNMELCSHLV